MATVDIYDDSMLKIGVAEKHSVHVMGFWHKSIHCWVVRKDSTGEYLLLQKRSIKKKLLPNCYDVSVAGHYESGECTEDVIRETKEELGLDRDFHDWIYLGLKFEVSRNEKTVNKEFSEVFMIQDDRELSSYTVNNLEIDELVQVKITDGLSLFAGEKEKVDVEGIRWNNNENKWESLNTILTKEMMLPRLDHYYAKIFTIADLYFKGYKYLYV